MPSTSVSIAVKNSLLLFLVIMCLHFLIKNALAETEPFSEGGSVGSVGSGSSSSTAKKEAPGADGAACSADSPAPAPLDPQAESKLAPVPAAVATGSCAAIGDVAVCSAVADMPVLKDDEHDLYQYVFGESIDTANKAECATQRPAHRGDTQPPPAPPKAGGSCTTPKTSSRGFGDVSGNMIIGTYKDEKALNGGEVFNGLTGYDGGHSMYEEV